MKIEQLQEISAKESESPENIVDKINSLVRAMNSLSNNGADLSYNIRADIVSVTTGINLSNTGAWAIKNKFYPAIPKAVFIGQFLPQNPKADYFAVDPFFTPNIWWQMGIGNSILEVKYTSSVSTTNKATITLIILY